VTPAVLEAISGQVPDDWLREPGAADTATVPPDARRRYVDYLLRRLEAPRPFVDEADRARAA
jgi:hypothetical protein